MSHLPTLVFYGLAAMLVASAIAVVSVRSIFYSATALVLALTSVAGLFFLLGADFLGAAQILVYIGGIMIIMLFVIMLSQSPKDALQRQTNDQWLPAIFIAIPIGIALAKGFRELVTQPVTPAELIPTSAVLGRLLLGDMLLPFEAVSLVLLAALIGAVLFSQDKIL